MNAPAALPDGHVLAECYEALRHDVLDAAGGRTLTGRALLMFKGMAAWIKAMAEAPVRPKHSVSLVDEKRVPTSFKQNLVNLVATMALATTVEVRA